MTTDNRAIIAAKYLPLLGEFRAPTDDVRYYLHGISIEPHESGDGAYLCATDGHRLVVVHDEDAVCGEAVIVNPDKIVIRESKRAKLADFDGECCDLQDETEAFLLRAPAPKIDGKFPDWRSLVPTEEVVCEPGSLDPALMASVSKAPFEKRHKDAFIYTRGQDKSAIVRIPSLPQIFVLIMPLHAPTMTTRPEWIRKRRAKSPQQGGFDLVSSEEETAVAAAARKIDEKCHEDGTTATLSNGNGEVLATFGGDAPDADPLLPNAIQRVRDENRASISFVQRVMKIGYNRAARLLETMEAQGIVSPPNDKGMRDVVPM